MFIILLNIYPKYIKDFLDRIGTNLSIHHQPTKNKGVKLGPEYLFGC